MKLAALILFFTIFANLVTAARFQPVYALTASESAAPADLYQSEIERIKDRVDKIRDEQYQHAIKVAEDSGHKADRLLNWLVGLATFFGFIILIVTFTIGKNIFDLLNELRAHAKAAKKSAQTIEGLATKAQQKGEQLVAEISAIKSLKKELTHSKDKTKEQELKLTDLLNQAQGTISEIQSLKSSAALVSGATLAYPPYGTVNVVEPAGLFTVDHQTKKCKVCNNSLPWYTVGQVPFGDPDMCFDCKMKARDLGSK